MNTYQSKEQYYSMLIELKDKNERIRDAYKYFDDMVEETDDKIQKFLNDPILSNEEFIYVVALGRRRGDGKFAGNGLAGMQEQIIREYKNTPWKFVEEFLQNADDCLYEDEPHIEITVDSNHSCIEFTYNERGFTRKDIWSLTQFADSTKTVSSNFRLNNPRDGLYYNEKTGRKGIGFKSVFALSAENVIIHIRSNGYSFKLDKKISSVIPVWEDDVKADGLTHVIVELVKPEFKLDDIYPKFKELFCVSRPNELFRESPILFMHRIKDITINNIVNGNKESFHTELRYDDEDVEYGKSMDSDNNILSCVVRKGKVSEYEWAKMCIQINENGRQILSTDCVRYSASVMMDGKYRLFSIIAPLISQRNSNWVGGALFRTFPLIDHQYQSPFAIDIPFELNSARKGIDFNATDFNSKIVELMFGKSRVFNCFSDKLRCVSNICIDQYFTNTQQLLFNDTTNRDDRGNKLIAVLNLNNIMQQLDVFPVHENVERYISYAELICVDKQLFSWPESTHLLKLLLGGQVDKLVAEKYLDCDLLTRKRKGVINQEFIIKINEYLDFLERCDKQKLSLFLKTNFYSYLADNYEDIQKIDGFRKLNIYLFRVTDLNGEYVVRENGNTNTKWITGTSKLSLGEYRSVNTMEVPIDIILPMIKNVIVISDIRYEFMKQQLEVLSKQLKSWTDVCKLLTAVIYYGYSVEGINFPVLNEYAVSEECSKTYNPFRDEQLVKIIPDEDIYLLASYGNVTTNKIVDLLISSGLRRENDYFNESGSYLVFNELTKRLINKAAGSALEKCLNDIMKNAKYRKRSLDIKYSELCSGDTFLKVFFLRNKDVIAGEAYLLICDACLDDGTHWVNNTNVETEILLRSVCGSRKRDYPINYKIRIDIEYLIDNRLGSFYSKAVESYGFDKILSINNRSFTRIASEDINPLIGFYAESKLEKENVFLKGNLLGCSEKKIWYLTDYLSKSIYLHVDEDDDYKEALLKYLKADGDYTKNRYIEYFTKQTQDVHDRIIAPVLNDVNHNNDWAFDELEQNFDKYSKQDIVNIIGWFRLRSYDKALGGAAASHEKEIEDDYKAEPWRFVYEFLQNVDDCSFNEEDHPEIIITVNENANQIVFDYNEEGFTASDIKALAAFGSSNKADSLEKRIPDNGLFDRERTGRKGRGFKSVFALPGKDIVVHISSNGFHFKFIKAFAEIIPVWENPEKPKEKGTRITIEGFQGNSIRGMYDNLIDYLNADNVGEMFAKSPLLCLRKLRGIKIVRGSESFVMNISEKNSVYSNQIFSEGNLRVVSGIRDHGKFKTSMSSDVEIYISKSGMRDVVVEAIREAYMIELYGETRLVTILAPIVKENEKCLYNIGALYHTLPLHENSYGIPLSINAPFEVNSGRSAVINAVHRNNNALIKKIFNELLKKFYSRLRQISDISIEHYIFEKESQNNLLFNEYAFVSTVNLEEITRNFPLLKLYSGEGFISCNEARVLTKECYKWITPVTLSKVFTNSKEDRLVEEKYVSPKFGVSRINFISEEFHNNINRYLDIIEQTHPEQFWMFMEQQVYPFIGRNINQLNSKYRSINQEVQLKEMKIFGYRTYDGSTVRENANQNSIWLSECPSKYKAFGKYRSLTNAPMHYSSSDIEWMAELLDIVSYYEAFCAEKLKLTDINGWNELKDCLETLLYFQIKPAFKIAYLSKCALSRLLSPAQNLFREAFVESKDSEVLELCIDQKEISEIIEDLKKVGDYSSEEIVKLIQKLGLKADDDYFDIERDVIRCSSSTLALLKSYCKDRERSIECINLLKEKSRELTQDKKRVLIIDYSDVSKCKNVLLTQILRQRLLKRDYLASFSYNLITDKHVVIQNQEINELLICAYAALDSDPGKKYNLNIKLSDVVSLRLGNQIQNALFNNNSKGLALSIKRDISTNKYESREVKQTLSWMQDSSSNDSSEINKYVYYTSDIQDAFENTKEGIFIFDSEAVILDNQNISENLLSFVQKKYDSKADGALLSGLIRIATIQHELKNNWQDSKKAYVERLAEFRSETDKYIKVLCPDYQRNINQSTGKTVEYLLPELLQNINDCRSDNDKDMHDLEIVVNPNEMILCYSEKGFDFSDVYSITAYGQSTKHDEREGEKGLGFKKVFSVFSKVDIYSNGFAFSLTKDKPIIPQWIDKKVEGVEQYIKAGHTTMVFHAGTFSSGDMKRIEEIWKDAVSNPQKPGLLMALHRIANYKLVCGDYNKTLSRGELLDKYYQAEVPLVKLYKKVLSQAMGNAILDDKMKRIITALRSRKKCLYMNDEEFDNYVDSLKIAVYVPKQSNENNNGIFFSTLPTSKKTGSNIYINLPLELTTGRNEILENSNYNKALWNMVFFRDGGTCSVINYIFCAMVQKYRDFELYNCFNGNADDYIAVVSSLDSAGNINAIEAQNLRSDFAGIPVFRLWDNSNKPVSLQKGYTVEAIVYDYISSVDDKKFDFQMWLKIKHPEISNLQLLAVRNGSSKELGKMLGFAKSVGANPDCYPLKAGEEWITISYFENEYAVNGEENEL